MVATIRDVARVSGFSVSTVSRVLNGGHDVALATQAAIEKAIRQLDYVPNALARDLSRGSTQTIGVVIPHSLHPFFAVLAQGIMEAAFAAGYGVTMLQSHYDTDVERGFLEQLRRKAFAGLIFTSHELPLEALAAYQRFAPVVVCQDTGTSGLPAAYADRRPAYEAVFRWLKQQGVGRLGLVLPRAPRVSATSSVTLAAYATVYGGRPAPEWLYTGALTNQDGQAAGRYYVGLAGQPQAILANGDDIAAGIDQVYQATGRPTPQLIGQERQLSGDLLGLPTIDHHLLAVGGAAFALASGQATAPVRFESQFLPTR